MLCYIVLNFSNILQNKRQTSKDADAAAKLAVEIKHNKYKNNKSRVDHLTGFALETMGAKRERIDLYSVGKEFFKDNKIKMLPGPNVKHDCLKNAASVI